jgi:parallel beta-helix repeat protein
MREGIVMRVSHRFALAVGVLALLGAFVPLSRWYQTTRAAPGKPAGSTSLSVTSGGDRGPGSLREALFVAATAPDGASIVIRVNKIAIATALPPLVNPHGVRVVVEPPGAEIDAQALKDGPVFDVDGADASIEGLSIRHCPGAAILLRAVRFRLTATTIESCDVAVEVAENASDLALERNRFTRNRLGVRFAASSRNAVVVKNEFSADTDAGLWAVRGVPDLRTAAISVHDNKFSNDRSSVVAGNVSLLLERNDFINTREAAIQLIGAGAVVRGNRVSGGAATGIVAENARGAIIEGNELDHLAAYGIMVRGSANTLVRGNRIHNCGYGMAFVLGLAGSPSTAVDNSLIDLKWNGIDVIGDSPILRRNQVLQARVAPLHVEDFQPPGGKKVPAHPFLDHNSFDTDATTAATADANHSPAKATAR